jgi:hypothetical protein
MSKLRVVLLTLILSAIGPLTASALPITLRLTDGTTTVTVSDGGAGDSNPFAGVVSYIGGVGDWNINVSTGFGSDILGLSTLDLNSVNSTQGTTSTLDISFTQVDNVFPVGGFAMEFGGTATNVGAISYSAYADDANAAFGQTQLIGTIGPFGSSPFSGVASGPVSVSGTYSLTQVLSITGQGGVGIFSADAELNPSDQFPIAPIPEPASLLLFGSGLSGLAAWRRRHRGQR